MSLAAHPPSEISSPKFHALDSVLVIFTISMAKWLFVSAAFDLGCALLRTHDAAGSTTTTPTAYFGQEVE